MKKISFLILFSTIYLGANSQSSKANKKIIQNLYTAFNLRNFKLFYSNFDDSVLVHFSNRKNYMITPNDIKSSIDPQLKAFPDIKDTISLILSERDWVSICVRHTGRNIDSLRELPPSNNLIDYNVLEMYRLKNKKIVEIYVVEDRLSMYQQMGIIPFNITKSLIPK